MGPAGAGHSIAADKHFAGLPLMTGETVYSSSIVMKDLLLDFDSLCAAPLILGGFLANDPLDKVRTFGSSAIKLSSAVEQLMCSVLFSIDRFLTF